MQLSIQLINFEQLQELGGAFSEELAEKLAPAMKDAVDANIVPEAQALAPVRSGTLRDSIHSDIIGEFEVVVMASAPYASFIEYGHRTRSGSLVPPHQFLMPAAIEGLDFITLELAQLVEDIFHQYGF